MKTVFLSAMGILFIMSLLLFTSCQKDDDIQVTLEFEIYGNNRQLSEGSFELHSSSSYTYSIEELKLTISEITFMGEKSSFTIPDESIVISLSESGSQRFSFSIPKRSYSLQDIIFKLGDSSGKPYFVMSGNVNTSEPYSISLTTEEEVLGAIDDVFLDFSDEATSVNFRFILSVDSILEQTNSINLSESTNIVNGVEASKAMENLKGSLKVGSASISY